MTTDPPADARDTLLESLESARERARCGASDEADELIGRIRTVAERELPEGSLKERLLHGCTEAATANGDEPLVAAEYLRAMAELVADAESGSESASGSDPDADGPDDPDGEP